MAFWIYAGEGGRVGPFETAERAACNLGSDAVRYMLAVQGGHARIRFAADDVYKQPRDNVRLGSVKPAPTSRQPEGQAVKPEITDNIRNFKADNVNLDSVKRDNIPVCSVKPCPAGAERQTLSVWTVQGQLDGTVSPCSIAAAFTRVFGVPPRRSHSHQGRRCYSLRELRIALGHLGLELQGES